MSRVSWSHLSSRTAVSVSLLLACLVTLHCDETENVVVSNSGPFSLRFSLAADFQLYAGETVSWVLVRSDNGERLQNGTGTISATTNPAYSVTTRDVLMFGIPHEMHYWIDSNIGGGTPGVCDPVVRDEDTDEIIEAFDMQWIAQFGGLTSDLVFIAIHSPDRVQNVCDSFPQ
jgi:hypothetical protein